MSFLSPKKKFNQSKFRNPFTNNKKRTVNGRSVTLPINRRKLIDLKNQLIMPFHLILQLLRSLKTIDFLFMLSHFLWKLCCMIFFEKNFTLWIFPVTSDIISVCLFYCCFQKWNICLMVNERKIFLFMGCLLARFFNC